MYQPSITNHRGWSPILFKKPTIFSSFLEAEAQALTEIKNTKTVRVPEVIAHGVENAQAYLVLEYIEEEEIHLLDRQNSAPNWLGYTAKTALFWLDYGQLHRSYSTTQPTVG